LASNAAIALAKSTSSGSDISDPPEKPGWARIHVPENGKVKNIKYLKYQNAATSWPAIALPRSWSGSAARRSTSVLLYAKSRDIPPWGYKGYFRLTFMLRIG
jgi:hypothetical protein